jgi:RHS repeat-associated protein
MFATNGLMVAWYLYDPFGNTLAKTGPLADANVYRFSCKAYHEPSGLYYYGYRFYSPDLQRWVNRDPIEEEGGINLYGFVENEPLSLVDPYGLDYGDWWDTRTWFNDGFTESWSDQANSIGQTLGEVLSGNWEDIENNYEDSSLGQAECIGGAVYTAERYLLAAAATATAAAAVTFAPTNPYLELALGAGLQLAFDALSPEGGDCDEGNPQVIGAIGPNGGQRSAEDQNRLDEQRDRRRIRREQESRVGTRQKQTGKGFRNLDSANKGPSGKSSSGIDTRHGRERNIGIDEEHSRVPKGSFGRPRR